MEEINFGEGIYKHFDKAIIRCPSNSIGNVDAMDLENLPPIFQEGIYLASPEFYAQLEKLKLDVLSKKDRQKALETLRKYWVRSCTRCTPYGTFAGTGFVKFVSEKTSLVLTTDEHYSDIRVDMGYLFNIVSFFLKNKVVAEKVLWFPNNSIYEQVNEYRYVERNIINSIPKYTLSVIEKTEYLKGLLEFAESGKLLKDLLSFLINNFDVDDEEADEYLEELIESQILTSSLEPKISQPDPLYNIRNLRDILKHASLDHFLLDEIIALITDVKDANIERYKLIEQKLRQLSPELPSPKNTLQSDLFLRCKSNELDKKIVDTIISQIEELSCLSILYKNSDLEEFLKKFFERYGDQEVPLSVVIDSDCGIGYSGLQDFDLGDNEIVDNLFTRKETHYVTETNFIHRLALKKYGEYVINRANEIIINEDDLKSLYRLFDKSQLPNSLYILGSLLKNEDEFTFDLSGLGGPSGANLLGRFSYGSEEIVPFIKEILNEEQSEYPESIYAEIIHLPESRLGNILLRPQLRDYEISYLGNSGLPIDYHIPITDLLVSVRRGKVQLRSKKLDKIVIPRLTTAHNFHYRSLPIYKFLCDLQSQDTLVPVFWTWGDLKQNKHLPRVSYKNIILSKSSWIIAQEDIKNWSELTNDEQKVEAIRVVAKERAIPEVVQYIEGDNCLLIDFSSDQSITILLKYLNRFNNVRLSEFLPNQQNCIVHDTLGRPYANEFIIPIYKKSETLLPFNKENTDLSIRRSFSPGGNWLYIKIYAGPKTVDELLTSVILPAILQFKEECLYEKFFYIRYKDDFNHLRIRFFHKEPKQLLILQQKLGDALNSYVDNGMISKWLVDTYDRELERYLPSLIDETESLFYFDSLAVLKILRVLATQDTSRLRVLAGVLGVNQLLNDFNLSNEVKYLIVKNTAELYHLEFGGSKILQKQLNDKFRAFRNDIITLLEEREAEGALAEVKSIIKERTISILEIREGLFSKIKEENHVSTLEHLLPSYIHMFINRLFLSQQRKYELLIYHLLERYLLSSVKRKSVSADIQNF